VCNRHRVLRRADDQVIKQSRNIDFRFDDLRFTVDIAATRSRLGTTMLKRYTTV
jgi:hypothetical protein